MAGNYGLDIKRYLESEKKNIKARSEALRLQAEAEENLSAEKLKMREKGLKVAKEYEKAESERDDLAIKKLKDEIENSKRIIEGIEESKKHHEEIIRQTRLESLRLEKRSEKYKDLGGQISNLAGTISKSLGAEEAYKRTLSEMVIDEIRENKEIAKVYKTGSAEDKDVVFDQMFNKLREVLEKNNPEDKDLIENAIKELTDTHMDELVSKSENMFHPLIKQLKSTAGAVRKQMQNIPLIGRLMSDEMTEHWRSAGKDILGEMNTHLGSILKPIDVLVGPFRSIGKSLMVAFKSLTSGPTEYEKSVVVYLKKIAGDVSEDRSVGIKGWMEQKKQWIGEKKQWLFSRKQWAISQRDKARELYGRKDEVLDGVKKFFKKGLMFVIAAVGLAAGALVKQIIYPFEIMFKSLRAIAKFPLISNFITQASKFINSLPVMGKVLANIGGVIGKVIGIFSRVGSSIGGYIRIGLDFLKKSSLIAESMGKFVKGFKLGLGIIGKALFWVTAIFDFVKGFLNTEGTILDKLWGGIEGVIIGFVKAPVVILSWLFEKVMGFFGVEIKGTADSIMSGVKNILGFVKDSIGFLFKPLMLWWGFIKDMIVIPFTAVFNTIKSVFTGVWDGLEKIFSGDVVEGLWEIIKSINPISILGDFLYNIFDSIVDVFSGIVDKVKDFSGKIGDFISNLIPDWAKNLLGMGKEKKDKAYEAMSDSLNMYDEVSNAGAVGVNERGMSFGTAMKNGYIDIDESRELASQDGKYKVLSREEKSELEKLYKADYERKRDEYLELSKQLKSSDVMGGIKDFFVGIWNDISNFFGKVGEVFTDIKNGLFDAISTIFNRVPEILSDVKNGIFGAISSVVDSFSEVFVVMRDGLFDSISSIVDKIGGIFSKIKDGLFGAASKIVDKVVNIFGFGGDDEGDEKEVSTKINLPETIKSPDIPERKWRGVEEKDRLYNNQTKDEVIPRSRLDGDNKIINKDQTSMVDVAAAKIKYEDDRNKKTQEEMGSVNKALKESINVMNNNTEKQISVINNNSSTNSVVNKKQIPDGVESIAVMFVNKSWGMT